MITLDTLFIVIFAVLLIYGLCRGLISIIIPILAIIATFLIAPLIYNHISKFFSHSAILKIISLIASYSIIRIILSKVEKSIKDILKVIYLSLNRTNISHGLALVKGFVTNNSLFCGERKNPPLRNDRGGLWITVLDARRGARR